MSRHSDTRLEVRYQHPDALRPDPRNPRAHGPRHVKQISKSIDAFGFNAPIAVDESNCVIAGHGRLEAAKLLKLKEVPTICLGHLGEHARTAYMVADNRMTDLSDWTDDNLAAIMAELADADLSFDLDATGFSIAEIDLMFKVDDAAEDKDDALPEPGVAVARIGDLFILGGHRILCASALEPESYRLLIGRERADLVFGDPPFNVPIKGHVSGLGKIKHREFAQATGEMSEAQFISFLERAFGNAADWSRDGSLHYWAMDWRHLHELTLAARSVYREQVNLCVWTKPAGGMGAFYRSQHELFAVWRKGAIRNRNNVELGRFGRSRTNVWAYASANIGGRTSDEGNLLALHPTVKPVQLVADAILDSTRRGDVVLDPFLGSGSTLIAAEKVGRRCRGIELDPLYIDTIIRRWQRWSGEKAVRADGVLFDDLEAAPLLD
jgi:DNA modification methylase